MYIFQSRFDESMSKAVMVWIHGGAYIFGDSLQSTYGPDFILGEDVILVTFNYRLGALGKIYYISYLCIFSLFYSCVHIEL